MADYSTVKASLERLEQEQRDRYRPAPQQEPRTPIEAYAKALDAARSRPAVSIDAGWLR